MYGVESCVDPAYRGQGVGSKLMDARFDVLRRLNLRGMIAGSAIIDYYKVADSVPVEQYVADVATGRRFDTNLSKQLHKGFKAHYPIPNYINDEEALEYGVLIVWENPDYRPEARIQRRAGRRHLDCNYRLENKTASQDVDAGRMHEQVRKW